MTILAWLEPAFLKIINMGITASYVILAVLLARLLLRRLPKRYSYALWAVVAFRLVCPVSIASLLSIFNFGVFDMTAATDGAALTYVPPTIGTMQEPAVSVGIPYMNSVISERLPAPTPGASVNPLQIWQAAGTVVWAAGLVALLAYAAISFVKLHRRMRGAVRMEGTLDVYEGDGIRSPFVLGMLRPRIYLPFRMEEAERAHVLAHERFHLRRGDHIIKPLAFLLTCVYWFNPLVWIAYVCMCADMEMRCDEAVLGTLPAERRADYSMTLLSLSAGRHFAAASPLAFGETSVKRRIKNALSFKKPAVWLAIVAVAMCVFIAVACATNAGKKGNETVKEPDITGLAGDVYGFGQCLYMTPLSSMHISDEQGTGELYQFTADGFAILDAQTREIKMERTGLDWAFEPVDDAAYTALFDGLSGLPTLAHEVRLQYDVGDGYIVYKMDDAVWLAKTGTHGGARAGEAYMWSVYSLTKLSSAQALTPTPPSVWWEVYAFDSCLYMTALSSNRISDETGTGELYQLQNDRFVTLDAESWRAKSQRSIEEWAYTPVDEAEYAALFDSYSIMPAPSISDYKTRLQCSISGTEILYKMDDEVWFARTAGPSDSKGKKYMWSIFRLKKIADKDSQLGIKSNRLPVQTLRAGRYITDDDMSWLDLYADGTFRFALHIQVSYSPSGNWVCENGMVKLLVEGDEAYRFTVGYDGGKFYLHTNTQAQPGIASNMVFRYRGDVPMPWEYSTKITASEDGVAEFLALAGSDLRKTGYDDDTCYNVTPTHVFVFNEAYRIFKFDKSCASYLLYENKVYPLGDWFGGWGFADAMLADVNGDGQQELYFTCSWGSGIHRAQAGYFDPAKGAVTMLEYAYYNGDLVPREEGNTVGLYAADYAHGSDFVNYTLTPNKPVANVFYDTVNGKIVLAETGTGTILDTEGAVVNYWNDATYRSDWLTAYLIEHSGTGAALTKEEQAHLSELAYYVSTCDPLGLEQPLDKDTHLSRMFGNYCWDADRQPRFWEPKGGRLPAVGTVVPYDKEDPTAFGGVFMDAETANGLAKSVFGRGIVDVTQDYRNEPFGDFVCEGGVYSIYFGDYWMWFEQFEEITPLANDEYFVRYTISSNPDGPLDEAFTPERTGELIVRRDADSMFGFSVRAIVRTPWE